eukprot:UC1_evm1s455
MHTDKSISKFLLDQISDGQITWAPLDVEYDCVRLGSAVDNTERVYTMRSGPGSTQKEHLKAQFPDDIEAIDAWYALLKQCSASGVGFLFFKLLPRWLSRLLVATGVFRFFKYASISLHEATSSIGNVTNKDLIAVLGYCWGDYGTSPRKAPLTMQAALTGHFRGSASYPVGGSSVIAKAIIPVIRRSGGRVFVRSRVQTITTTEDGAQVTGIRLENGAVINAPIVISDAGFTATYYTLLAEAARPRLSDFDSLFHKRRELRQGAGCMTVFVGLRASASELELPAQNTWQFPLLRVDGTEDIDQQLADFE